MVRADMNMPLNIKRHMAKAAKKHGTTMTAIMVTAVKLVFRELLLDEEGARGSGPRLARACN